MTRLHLLFDLDGTLTDPREGIERSIRHALDRLGLPPPEDTALAGCVGPPLRDIFAALLGPADSGSVEAAVRHYRERYGERGLYENRAYDGIASCLAELSEVAPLYVATAKPAAFAREVLFHFSLDGFFRGVYGAEPDGTRSDKGELIAYLLAHEGIDPRSAAMIGDRASDIRGAIANAVRPCGVTWGYGSVDELQAAGAATLFQRPDELPPHFRREASASGRAD